MHQDTTEYDDAIDDRPFIVRAADDADEAIHAIAHDSTTLTSSIPAPVVYEVLGTLKLTLGRSMPEALSGVADGLLRSLETHDVRDGNGDPAENAHAAVGLMRAAADHAARMGKLLEEAQSRIRSQDYPAPDEP